MDSKSSTVFDCSIVKFDTIKNKPGSITIIENGLNTPFAVKRIYYLYDIPGGKARGGHAHKELQQFVFAASGSFEVVLDDGQNKRKVFLNRPNVALHIIPGIWRTLGNFSSGSICLVLASHTYDEEDYIRDYQQFVAFKKSNHDSLNS